MWRFVLCAFLLAVLPTFVACEEGKPSSSSEPQAWEHKCVELGYGETRGGEGGKLETISNELGEEGWKMVFVSLSGKGDVCFVRPKR